LSKDEIAALQHYLGSFDLFAGREPEGIGYLNAAIGRFLITLEMMPEASDPQAELLELGANPYFFTLMLKQYRNYRITTANYFGKQGPTAAQDEQVITSVKYGETHPFVYDHFNVEKDPFPYADDRFDLVLCCEILEHLPVDPTQMLFEIHRVLKPEGKLLLTTPNALAYQNLWRLATGHNIYDQYSGYGVYGRHNREYAPAELLRLLQACNYDIIEIWLEDIYGHPPLTRLLKRVRKHWRDNIFVLAQAKGEPRYGYPGFLYRSLYQPHHLERAAMAAEEGGEV
jgi:SAM-dependent methyltransferase